MGQPFPKDRFQRGKTAALELINIDMRHRPPLDELKGSKLVWVFDDNAIRSPVDREHDLAIRARHRGRDDFRHVCYRLSDGEPIFGFDLGKPFGRALTTDERSRHPQLDDACVWLIVDVNLTPAQRQSVLEWLQCREDGIVAWLRAQGRPRQHQLMVLQSAAKIDGF